MKFETLRLYSVHKKWPQSQLPFWTILSIHRMSPISYWVYAECRLNCTEYRLRENFAFGQTKPPLTHLNWLFIGKYLQGGWRRPWWTFLSKNVFQILKFSSVCAYTEYKHYEPSLHTMSSIKKFLFQAVLWTDYIQTFPKKRKFITSKILCQCTIKLLVKTEIFDLISPQKDALTSFAVIFRKVSL